MNEATILYTFLALIVGLSLAFLVLAFKRRSKASMLETGVTMVCFLGLAVFALIFGQGIKLELDPGTAHPYAYNGGKGCNPDCLPPTIGELKAELGIK